MSLRKRDKTIWDSSFKLKKPTEARNSGHFCIFRCLKVQIRSSCDSIYKHQSQRHEGDLREKEKYISISFLVRCSCLTLH